VRTADTRRAQAFLRRFPGREHLSTDQLLGSFTDSASMSRGDVTEALTLVSDELEIPIGLLRPQDLMSDLLKPLHSGNPLLWIAEWTRAADGKSELNHRLKERLRQRNLLHMWPEIPTLEDFVRAWCGTDPSGGAHGRVV
jgi:hypothetical protein